MTDIPQRRGSGRTTKQLREAPQGALFVWCTPHTEYARALAHHLGRNDITVISSEDLVYARVVHMQRGRGYSAIVVDHTLRDLGLSPDQMAGYEYLTRTQVR